MNQRKFEIRRTGTIGLEIISPHGFVIAWAADDVIGALLVDLLNKNRASNFEAKEHDE